MPRLSRAEKLILRASERRELFEEKFWAINKIAGPPSAKLEGPGATARDRAASVAFGKKLGLQEDETNTADVENSGPDGERIPTAMPSPRLGRTHSSDAAASTSPPAESSVASSSGLPSSQGSSRGPPPSASPPRSRLQSSSSHLSLASSYVTSNNDHHTSRSPTPSTHYGQPSGTVTAPPTTPFQPHSPYQQPQTPTLGGFGMGPPPPGKGKRVSKDTHYFETGAWFRGISVPIRIPLATFDEEVGDVSSTCLNAFSSKCQLTNLHLAVLAHPLDPDLLARIARASTVQSAIRTVTSHGRTLDEPDHPPLQRAHHPASSHLPRPRQGGGSGRQLCARSLRARKWRRGDPQRLHCSSFPVREPGRTRYA